MVFYGFPKGLRVLVVSVTASGEKRNFKFVFSSLWTKIHIYFEAFGIKTSCLHEKLFSLLMYSVLKPDICLSHLSLPWLSVVTNVGTKPDLSLDLYHLSLPCLLAISVSTMLSVSLPQHHLRLQQLILRLRSTWNELCLSAMPHRVFHRNPENSRGDSIKRDKKSICRSVLSWEKTCATHAFPFYMVDSWIFIFIFIFYFTPIFGNFFSIWNLHVHTNWFFNQKEKKYYWWFRICLI